MQTHDKLFSKEFKDMMFSRRNMSINNPKLSFLNIPTPHIGSMRKDAPKTPLALIRGITEPYFDKLNNSEVQLVGKTTLYKRKVKADGTFWLDDNGKFISDEVDIPSDCLGVLSDIPIGLRRFTVGEDGKKVEVKVTEGFKYVDFIEKQGKRKYIYIIPKKFVYKLSLCALILTPNRHRVFYKGCRLALQNGSYIYMYVIPFTVRNGDRGYKVLGVKSTYVFNEEVNTLLKYWQEIGVLFNLSITKLENPVNDITNLGLMDIEGTCSSDDFTRFKYSMAEKDDIEEDL